MYLLSFLPRSRVAVKETQIIPLIWQCGSLWHVQPMPLGIQNRADIKDNMNGIYLHEKALKQRKLNWDDCKAGRRPTRLCSLLGTNPYFQIKKYLLTLYFDPVDKIFASKSFS